MNGEKIVIGAILCNLWKKDNGIGNERCEIPRNCK